MKMNLGNFTVMIINDANIGKAKEENYDTFLRF